MKAYKCHKKCSLPKRLSLIAFWFFAITFIVYWFNLDTKLVHKLFPIFNQYYDRLPRDRRL